MTAAQAVDLVAHFRSCILAQATVFNKRWPDLTDFYQAHVDQALTGHGNFTAAVNASFDRVDPALAGTVISNVGDMAVNALWERGRNVYDIDAELWGQLARVDRATPLPADLFARLRHTDPFIRLPTQSRFDLADGAYAVMAGFFACGRVVTGESGHAIVSTHHHASNGLSLLFGAPVYRPDGKPFMVGAVQDVLSARIEVNPSAGDSSINAMIDHAIGTHVPGVESGDFEPFIRQALPQAVAALIYLCADNADLCELPTPPVKGPGGRRVKRHGAPRMIEVGYRVGRAIVKGRELAGMRRAAGGTGEGGGWVMPPHIRAPHFQRFRVGKGRTEVRVRWVDPVEVNFHLGGVKVPTVRRVKSARKAPAASA